MILSDILFDITIKGAVAQGMFLAFLFNSSKNLQRKQNRILSILLSMLSMSLLYSLYVQSASEVFNKSPFQFNEPFILIIGPLLWLYVKELTEGSVKLSAKNLIHFIPIIGFTVFFIPFHVHSRESLYVDFVFRYHTLIGIAGASIVVMQYSYYLFKISKLLVRHRKLLQSEFSNISDKSLAWIIQVMVLFILLYVSVLVLFFLVMHQYDIGFAQMAGSFIVSILIFWIGYKGMFQPQIFSVNCSGGELSVSADNELKETAEPASGYEQEIERLKTVMHADKPYLNPDLTLADLAKSVNVPRNTLSYIINNALKENFYSFINSYRVEEVKASLTDPGNKDFTILALAFDAGFNSKSTFNSIFKQKTGLSPSQYRSGRLQPAVNQMN